MQIKTETQGIEIDPTMITQTMVLDVCDPVLWQALSATIYTKARWILEYAQNARDVDPNWKLTLPSILDSNCTFYDEGPSMSEDFMLSRGEYANRGFCTAFSSTKRDTDETSGGFGIGRLSGPQGTVFECRNEDAIRTYILIKNENKIPMVVQQSVAPRPIDMPIGVTVRVPIAPRLISTVISDAQKFLRFFQPSLPACACVNYLLRQEHWGILETNEQLNNSATIVVGGYPFAINLSDIPGLRANGYSPYQGINYQILSNPRVVIWLPVGSVDVALNRESLRYSEHTVTTILQAVDDLKAAVPAELTKLLMSCETLWQARLCWIEIRKSFPQLSTIAPWDQTYFQGEILGTTTPLDNTLVLPHACGAVRNCNRDIQNTRRGYGKPQVQFKEISWVQVSKNALFIINDGVRCIKERLEYTRTDDIYLLHSETASEILKWLGNPPSHKLSEYAIPPEYVKSKTPRATHAHAMFEFRKSSYGSDQSVNTYSTEKTLPQVAVWTACNNRQSESKNFQRLMRSPYAPSCVIGVPKRDRALVGEDWITLEEHVTAQLVDIEVLSKAVYARDILNTTKWNSDKVTVCHNTILKISNYSDLKALLEYHDLIHWLNSLVIDELSNQVEACALLDIDIPVWQPVTPINLSERIKPLIAQYPLLQTLGQCADINRFGQNDYPLLVSALKGGATV